MTDQQIPQYRLLHVTENGAHAYFVNANHVGGESGVENYRRARKMQRSATLTSAFNEERHRANVEKRMDSKEILALLKKLKRDSAQKKTVKELQRALTLIRRKKDLSQAHLSVPRAHEGVAKNG